jgi:hypothetical protein
MSGLKILCLQEAVGKLAQQQAQPHHDREQGEGERRRIAGNAHASIRT